MGVVRNVLTSLCSYSTVKLVKIQSWKLSLFFYLIQRTLCDVCVGV